MILLIILSIIFLFGIFLIVMGVHDSEGDIIELGFFISIVILLINIISFWTSFDSAIEADVIHQGLITQYRSAITMYEDKAVLNIKDVSYTDFKYERYQKNMADMIRDIRTIVHQHNNILISKRAYKNNLFFGIYISMPESDQLIHIIDPKEQPQQSSGGSSGSIVNP
jgi:hypothetical protein